MSLKSVEGSRECSRGMSNPRFSPSKIKSSAFLVKLRTNNVLERIPPTWVLGKEIFPKNQTGLDISIHNMDCIRMELNEKWTDQREMVWIRGERCISDCPSQAFCKNILLHFPLFIHIVYSNMASLKPFPFLDNSFLHLPAS